MPVTASQRHAPSPGSYRWLLAALLFAATLAAHAPGLAGGFVWDDHSTIEGGRLHDWSSVAEVFRRDAMWSAGAAPADVPTYRPIALATFVIDYKLWGLRAFGFHLTSVLLHAVTQVLVFLMLGRWTRSVRGSFVLTLVCAWHPSTVEAVAWINGRSDVLALLGGSAALLSANGQSRSWWRAAVTGAALLLGMLGKETALVFAPLAVAASAIRWGAEDQFPVPRLHVPTVVAAGVATAAFFALRHGALRGASLPGDDFWARALLAAPATWFRATQAALIPIDRSPFTFSSWLRDLGTLEQTAYALGALAALGILAVQLARRRYAVAMGFGWWLAAVLPTTAVVGLDYPWPGLNRWLYPGLPGLALGLYAAAGARLRPAAAKIVSAAVGLAALALTLRAIPVWRSDVDLYATMVEEWPEEPYGYRALGQLLIRAGRLTDAEALLRRSVEIDRSEEGPSSSALLGLAVVGLDRCDEGVAVFRSRGPSRAVPPPSFAEAAAECYRRTGRLDRALQLFAACAAESESCATKAKALGVAPP